MKGDMEGTPPFGEPITFMGMLYAAGYGDGVYSPENASIPFQARDKHGLFRFWPESSRSELVLSVEEVLQRHPYRTKLMQPEDVVDVILFVLNSNPNIRIHYIYCESIAKF